MIDWIIVDDIVYRWSGQEIVCETKVGYSTTLDGSKLDGLEITDSTGNISGLLFVDFAIGSLSYNPLEDQLPDSDTLHYLIDGHETIVTVSQLPVITSLDDVVVIDNEDMVLWSSIASISQIHTESSESIRNMVPMDHTISLNDDGNNHLDLMLQNIHGTESLFTNISVVGEVPLSLKYGSESYFNSESINALDILMHGNSST